MQKIRKVCNKNTPFLLPNRPIWWIKSTNFRLKNMAFVDRKWAIYDS